MPIYTYSCDTCNAVLEKRQSFTDEPLKICDQCGGALRKVIHPVGIVFKGSGWYVTDSRSSKQSTNGTSKPSESTESGSSGASSEPKESKKSDSTPTKSAEPSPAAAKTAS